MTPVYDGRPCVLIDFAPGRGRWSDDIVTPRPIDRDTGFIHPRDVVKAACRGLNLSPRQLSAEPDPANPRGRDDSASCYVIEHDGRSFGLPAMTPEVTTPEDETPGDDDGSPFAAAPPAAAPQRLARVRGLSFVWFRIAADNLAAQGWRPGRPADARPDIRDAARNAA